MGSDQNPLVAVQALRFQLRRLHAGEYSSAHLPYSREAGALIHELEIPVILPIRDPRDIVVSNMYHVLGRPKHFLHRYIVKLPTKRERLLAFVRGITDHQGHQITVCLGEQLELFSEWFGPEMAPMVLPVRFEELVGEAGGSVGELRDQTVLKMGKFLGIELTEEEAAEIGTRSFGLGSTFRAGQIGGWRLEFGDDGELVAEIEATCRAHMDRWNYER